MRREQDAFQSAAILTAAVCTISLLPERALPRCPVKYVTGYDCPGCGLQRAYRFVVRGQISDAVSANALIFTLPAFLLAMKFSERFAAKQALQRSIVALAITITVAFTLLRNRGSSRLASS
jgi:hypothetical protein